MFGLDLPLTLLLILCITAALTFEFINGFHDTANAVATVIYTHSLKPRVAVIWSGLWNFIGVNVGGIAVAVGIINLLPMEALTENSLAHSLAMIMALIITAIIWNIGTWYMGIPCSSSHTLIGSIFGVGIAYMLLPDNQDIILNWGKIKDTGLSLLISPLIGFFAAMLLLWLLKMVIRNKVIFKEPKAKKPPPLWVRSILVLTCTSVSFSHGSNDGQKGVGLIMIILMSIVPMRFALDHSKDPAKLQANLTIMRTNLARVDTSGLDIHGKQVFREVSVTLDSLTGIFTGITSFGNMSRSGSMHARKDILVVSKKSEILIRLVLSKSVSPVDHSWITQYRNQIKELRSFTEYSPWWVILMISLALGMGTMVGWRRIVVTIGEKIGKTHLTYAQGASAELVAAITISASSWLGLPVSTTHVLSSGVAGSMVTENGFKNLQSKTVASIGVAWLITLPVTMLLSGSLLLLFRMFFA